MIFALLAAAAVLSSDEALQRLMEGNQRAISGELLHANLSEERRTAVALKQKPFAVIIGCSDSRVPPEIIFDEGLGDLFVVRVAGNVVGPLELDTIEYGICHLGAAVIVVMGHERCGAVDAVFTGNAGDIKAIAKLIAPAIKGQKTLDDAVVANVEHVVDYLHTAPVLKRCIREKKVKIVGAYYDLATGEVTLLER